MNTEYIWSNKNWKRLGFSKLTGKPVKSRILKKIYKVKNNDRKHMVHGMGLKIGDIIQTCRDYFNHRIESFEVEYNDWCHPLFQTVGDITFCYDGTYQCSWNNCSQLPMTVKEIEEHYLNVTEQDILESYEESYYSSWHGIDNEEGHKKFKAYKEWAIMINTRLKSGLPITDEFGICLSECKFVNPLSV